jgi:hypothetical protein
MRTLTLLAFATALVAISACSDSPVTQKTYGSPEAAVEALVSAVKDGETRALLKVLGPETEAVVESGDPVQDQNAREKFVSAYEAAHKLTDRPEGGKVLDVGEDDWPFPFPLVEENGKWRFDSEGGIEEIVNRRVGENELFTIQACLAYVDAQREYYLRNPEGDALLHYASLLRSSEGKRDGLYFEVSGEEPESPLGPGFARARAEGYFQDEEQEGPVPFHGYYYRILTAQGPNAAGGAYEYVVQGKMLGGFGLVAYPAEYGSSGVMTFIVNQDGVVFSKDLGADTEKIASEMTIFDPDSTWKREETT